MRKAGGRFVLTIIAYVLCTFAVQGASHFWLNVEHFAAITIMRAEPLVPMGIGSMIIQASLFALLFPRFHRGGSTIRSGLQLSWAFGAMLLSYIALAEAGKYAIPSIGAWIVVESTAAAVQFTAFGLLLGLINRSTTERLALIASA